MADTMGSSIKFDCKWLLQYDKLNTLWLGKKAKKNIENNYINVSEKTEVIKVFIS